MNKFYLTHLYPDKMSIYGDMGNIITLKRKLTLMGYDVIYQAVNYQKPLPIYSDFYFMGGGQDNDQFLIFNDLLTKKDKLFQDLELGVPLLTICGGYQLFGQEFTTGDGKLVQGLGLFPVITKSLDTNIKSRCIGNLVVELGEVFKELQGQKIVGFENHGGQTTFVTSHKNYKSSKPIGKTVIGYGNDFNSETEGCVYKNAIGTYLHGSCLPKNPNLANYLIKKALEIKSFREGKMYQFATTDIDDEIAILTQSSLISRFQNENN
jgi:lipid II isoglutaminyl synthase (glutamine-hydrolysing)